MHGLWTACMGCGLRVWGVGGVVRGHRCTQTTWLVCKSAGTVVGARIWLQGEHCNQVDHAVARPPKIGVNTGNEHSLRIIPPLSPPLRPGNLNKLLRVDSPILAECGGPREEKRDTRTDRQGRELIISVHVREDGILV